MSKAEDLSKQYREFREQCGIKDPVMLNEIEEAYFEGYHQAREDVEITRDEMIEKACEYLDGLIEILNDRGHQLKKKRIIGGFKQALKDE